MPIEVLGKKRESLTFQSEAYKKLVREYLESEGYASRTDSFHEGHLADIILTHISEPDEELWVESKSTKISHNDEELKKELLKYLIESAKRDKKVRVRLFATGIAKQREFQKILTKKHGPSLIPEWISKTISEMKPDEQEELNAIGQDKIIDFFINNLDIKIAEPDWLRRVTSEREKSNRLSTDRYVEDLFNRSKRLSEPFNNPVELITSMIEIQHPDKIYRAVSPKYKSKKGVYSYFKKSNQETPPFTFFPEKQQISSFCKFDDENPLTKIIDKKSISLVSITKDEVSQQNIHSILNIHLRRIFWKKGLLRVPDKYIYYFPANEEDGEAVNREVKGVKGKGKVMVHVYRKKKDKKIHHVFHHAVEIMPQRLWGKTFLKLRPTKVFTSDGKTLVTGKKKRSLDEKYRNPLFNRNPAQLLDTSFWHAFISSKDNYEKEKEEWFKDIKFGALVSTISPYSPKIQIDTDQRKLVEFKK